MPGLSDGGAHCGIICDASFPTYLLTHWTRDRKRGEKLSIPFVVASQSRKTALSVGLSDRGLLAPGYKADVNVIDYDRLHLHPPKVHYDLPVGGRRLLQQVEGYDATIVSGLITRRDGQRYRQASGQADPRRAGQREGVRRGGGVKVRSSSRPSEARAGTHNHRPTCVAQRRPSSLIEKSRGMGPRFRGDDGGDYANFGWTACSPISRARSVFGHSSKRPSRPEPTRMQALMVKPVM